MTNPSAYARDATAALHKILPITPGDFDADGAAAVIEKAIRHATRERDGRSRRQLSEVKATAQQRLARLLSSSPAVVYSFKASGDFAPTFVSDNISAVFGYTPAEYLENPSFWRDRVHPDDLARVEEAIAKFFHNGMQSVEYRFRRRDGSYCWVNDAQRLVRGSDGKPLEIVGSWSDITVRKAAEEANTTLHARMAQLVTSSPAVIYSYKATGDFAPTFVSENIRDWLGYEPEEYLENADFWRSRVHPDDLAATEAESVNLFKHGRHTVEYRFLKKDGSYCWVNDAQQLIRDREGQAVEVIGSVVAIGRPLATPRLGNEADLFRATPSQVAQRRALFGVGERALDCLKRGARLVGFGRAAGAGIHVPDFVRYAGCPRDLPKPAGIHIPTDREVLRPHHHRASALFKRGRLKQGEEQGVLGQVEIGSGAVFRLRGFHAPAPTGDVLPGEEASPLLAVNIECRYTCWQFPGSTHGGPLADNVHLP
jgi:PAS domain S-box-containing protein